MSDYSPSNAELVAAVEKERAKVDDHYRLLGDLMAKTRRAHLDTLAAILSLHQREEDDYGVVSCATCLDDVPANPPGYWPCPTVDIVVAALRKMGAIE